MILVEAIEWQEARKDFSSIFDGPRWQKSDFPLFYFFFFFVSKEFTCIVSRIFFPFCFASLIARSEIAYSWSPFRVHELGTFLFLINPANNLSDSIDPRIDYLKKTYIILMHIIEAICERVQFSVFKPVSRLVR